MKEIVLSNFIEVAKILGEKKLLGTSGQRYASWEFKVDAELRDRFLEIMEQEGYTVKEPVGMCMRYMRPDDVNHEVMIYVSTDEYVRYCGEKPKIGFTVDL